MIKRKIVFFCFLLKISFFKRWFYHVSPIPEKVDEDKKLASEARKAEILFTYSSQAIDSVYQFNEVLKEADWKHRNPSWRSSHFQNLFRFVLINSWNLWKSVQINEEKKESEEEEKKEKKLALNGTSFNSFLQKLQLDFKFRYEEGFENKKEEKKKKAKKRRREEKENKSKKKKKKE